MEYELSSHAIKRIKERLIPKRLIEESLRNPTEVLYDEQGRILIKKLYKINDKQRLSLIAGILLSVNNLKIITVIDTSKIKKYL